MKPGRRYFVLHTVLSTDLHQNIYMKLFYWMTSVIDVSCLLVTLLLSPTSKKLVEWEGILLLLCWFIVTLFCALHNFWTTHTSVLVFGNFLYVWSLYLLYWYGLRCRSPDQLLNKFHESMTKLLPFAIFGIEIIWKSIWATALIFASKLLQYTYYSI